MRISSALDINIKDLDFTNMLITMHKSKNRKTLYIPMSNTLYTVLQEYLIYRQGEDTDYLFCNLYKNKGNIHASRIIWATITILVA